MEIDKEEYVVIREEEFQLIIKRIDYLLDRLANNDDKSEFSKNIT